jgi:hypothetical protein
MWTEFSSMPRSSLKNLNWHAEPVVVLADTHDILLRAVVAAVFRVLAVRRQTETLMAAKGFVPML